MSTCRLFHSATEFRDLFERHSKTLLDQKLMMINEIDEWGNNLVHQVEQNLTRQKKLVEHEYQLQLNHLRQKHQEYLDTAFVYEEQKNREEIRLLLEQCHTLKLQLGSFDYPEQTIPFIQIHQEQQSLKTHASNEHLTINEDLRRNDYQNLHTKTSPPSTNPTCMNDNMTEKCPACSMIFPLCMGADERSRHVNQHFGDS
ncbi:hypothetical protein I4U23_024109 [Adineta vaga]|nr:hypothetical protein I4U23_024109 [Adineta vaga]